MNKTFCLAFCVFSAAFCADASPLKPLWRAALGGTIESAPLVTAGRGGAAIVSIVDGGRLTAVDANGQPLWTWKAAAKLLPFLTRSRSGALYAADAAGRLVSLTSGGHERWTFTLDKPLASPLIEGYDNRVFASTRRTLYCLTESGYMLWRFRADSSIDMGPVSDGEGGVVCALENGTVILVNAFGEVSTLPSPALPSILIAINSGARTAEGAMFAVLSVDGLLTLWKGEHLVRAFFADAKHITQAASFSNRLLLAGEDGVAMISLTDGHILWNVHQPVVKRDTEIVFSAQGLFLLQTAGITEIEANTGSVFAHMALEKLVSPPAAGPDGRIYGGGSDWLLYAWQPPQDAFSRAFTTDTPPPPPRFGYGTSYFTTLITQEVRSKYVNLPISRYLEIIEKNIKDGNVDGNERLYKAILMSYLASQARMSGSLPLPSEPEAMDRLRAVHLLSLIGSSETTRFLMELWRRERDDTVKTALAKAAAVISVDPERLALSAFARELALASPHRDALFGVIAETLFDISLFSGPVYALDAIPILTLIADNHTMKNASEKARACLERLVTHSR